MSKEAMKLALEALKQIDEAMPFPVAKLAQAALREALAEQPARPYRLLQDNGSKYFGDSWDKAEQPAQQEPVALAHKHINATLAAFGPGEAISMTKETWAKLREAMSVLIEQTPQREPVVLKWQQAPIQTAWGDDMVVASIAIDKDHTLSLYCERDQTPKVDAVFAQRTWVGLTDEEKRQIFEREDYQGWLDYINAIEAKLRSKNEDRN